VNRMKAIAEFLRSRATKLSGWSRLWIVLIAPFWLFSMVQMVSVENDRWKSECSEWINSLNSLNGKGTQNVQPSAPTPPRTEKSPFAQARRQASKAESPPVILRNLGDGSIAKFPAGTSEAIIAKAIRKYDQEARETAIKELGSRQCLRHQNITNLFLGFVQPTAGALFAFFLALLAKSAVLWVWTGFRKQGQP
jgi:hypothetical protein